MAAKITVIFPSWSFSMHLFKKKKIKKGMRLFDTAVPSCGLKTVDNYYIPLMASSAGKCISVEYKSM